MSHHYSGPDFGLPHRDARLDRTRADSDRLVAGASGTSAPDTG
jgi:hypothetical protein